MPTEEEPLPDSTASDPADVVTGAILIGGGLLYAMLCSPVIGQRGYPPIDPFWNVMPFLWFIPLALALIYDERPTRARTKLVAVYALATAFIDAGQVIMVVPHRPNVFEMAINTLFFFGPYHLVVAIALEGLAKLWWHLLNGIAERHPSLALTVQRSVAVLLVVGAAAAPFIYRNVTFERIRQRARHDAEQAWKEHRPEVYGRRHDGGYVRGILLSHDYDPETGFHLEWRPRFFGYEAAYNGRVAELLAQHGVPEWSMKTHLVSDDDLIAMLDSSDLPEITKFPYAATDKIMIEWPKSIRTPGGSHGFNHEDLPVYAGRSTKDPCVVFVRAGNKSISAFHEDGSHLSFASRH